MMRGPGGVEAAYPMCKKSSYTSKSGETFYLRCIKEELCPARATEKNGAIVSIEGVHNHPVTDGGQQV